MTTPTALDNASAHHVDGIVQKLCTSHPHIHLINNPTKELFSKLIKHHERKLQSQATTLILCYDKFFLPYTLNCRYWINFLTGLISFLHS